MTFRECRTAEANIGMKYYFSESDGTGGRLKVSPDDFVVDEISIHPEPADGGKYTIAKVTARNWETNHMVRLMSRQLNMSRERISFAGTKDKRAVTSQLMSFECPPEQLGKLNLKDLNVTDTYTSKRKIQIGDLIGNRFDIRVTGITKPKDEVESIVGEVAAGVKKLGGFPNYFGVQRFGVMRPITHIVGEKIAKGDVEGAVMSYVCDPSVSASQDTKAAEMREKLRNVDEWPELINEMPETMSFEKTMVQYIVDKPGDWTGAIACMPTNLQMMFIHAYQSYLFNLMLSERIARDIPLNRPIVGDVVVPLDADGIPDHDKQVLTTSKNIDMVERQLKLKRAYVTIALFGSDTLLAEGEMGEIERKVISENHIEEKDFVLTSLPHCSSTGSRREIVCPVKDLGYTIGDSTYNVSFSLPKGNYATCLMREFMKSEMTDY
ncbi:MAG: tRNA pseudouridine(13) synthase TruD [archaeon]|nr:tRNA pseudouridine(13) synthase TruD [archaeon]